MNRLAILIEQTQDTYNWVNRLVESIPKQRWDTTPAKIDSNITWQVGHLIVSFYYHSIMVIAGHQTDLLQKIPLKEYGNLFTDGDPKSAIGRTDPIRLLSHLVLMEKKSLETIGALCESDLDTKLEPAQFPHPIAKNKFGALDWNIKHTMWHCGQIGMIRRTISERYDFGLKKDR